ncbi:MAG TPA: SDR family oxidoreductase [Acidimicrobiales bacterium]|nr:SDR family oxidoreductase [Acidimicrobiales bacterium]
MSLNERVALVTGGGRGIGRAISLALAGLGADVAVNYRKDEESAEATAGEIRALGRRAMAVRASVDDFDADAAMVDAVTAELGPIGILVNNAGLASRGQSVVDTDPAELPRLLGTHAVGVHRLCALVVPAMRSLGRGDIVMISSVAATGFAANGAPYTMAKAAMEALAFTLAKEERPHGIRVNVVAPGLVDTEMGRRLVKGAMGVADIRTLDASAPFGRVCAPEDVAEVVAFLVSAGYVSGQRVAVDGGGR